MPVIRGLGDGRGGHSLNRLIPNALTLLALCAGITAMRYALDQAWERAVIAVMVASVLDGLDGRIARALKAQSRFGAELDSLSDIVCFGVAPAVVIYLWSLNAAGGLGWALALLFAVCCALRLARFNIALDEVDRRPAWMHNYFVGVPAPAAAGLALLPLVLGLQFEESAFANPGITGLTMIGVSALMVSRLPTFAFKRVKIPGRYVVFALLGVGASFAFLISTPWITLAVAGFAYLASIPYASMVFKRRQREQAAGELDDQSEVEDELAE
ncbi:MAG: CDP-diacylglycerol--serine O-phosphatidyltransferase [Kiloniellales bacterium]